MKLNFTQPLSVYFVWHPADECMVRPIVDYCFKLLSRDVKKPFSRSMNLPVFYRTTNKKGIPRNIDSSSGKTIVFIFVSKEVMCDESWIEYLIEISKNQQFEYMPIAIDRSSLSLSKEFGNTNFIRAYDFEATYLNEYMFISIAHEIYRFTLNERYEEKSIGTDTALKIFISHAKDGENGIVLAEALKKFIDNTAMRNFFDATDIAPGYKFDEEIINNIKGSTVIAIHSDIYSSRYWCQRELLCAKENNRPIIAVDTLEDFEDRRFPFASNIPGVHVHLNNETTKKDILRILIASLLETVRYFYAKALLNEYKICGLIDANTEICPRPPEASDILKILSVEGTEIKFKFKNIVYPEPPVYVEELNYLSCLGVKISTPLTFDLINLKDKRVGISISDPSEEELMLIGNSNNLLTQLAQDIARHFIARESNLIYGGDIRPDGFTQFIFDEAQALKIRTNSENVNIYNYLAWPIYNNDTDTIKEWKSKYRSVARMKDIPYPDDVIDLIPNEKKDLFLPPNNVDNLYVWSRCLTEMRYKMITDWDVRICAGGRHTGYKGKMPGILEEILIAFELERPIYLLGGFGGVTSSVCETIMTGTLAERLTQDWQIHNQQGYNALINYYTARGERNKFDYNELPALLKIEKMNNGLSVEDNIKLFKTHFIDEAIFLIFKGLKKLYSLN